MLAWPSCESICRPLGRGQLQHPPSRLRHHHAQSPRHPRRRPAPPHAHLVATEGSSLRLAEATTGHGVVPLNPPDQPRNPPCLTESPNPQQVEPTSPPRSDRQPPKRVRHPPDPPNQPNPPHSPHTSTRREPPQRANKSGHPKPPQPQPPHTREENHCPPTRRTVVRPQREPLSDHEEHLSAYTEFSLSLDIIPTRCAGAMSLSKRSPTYQNRTSSDASLPNNPIEPSKGHRSPAGTTSIHACPALFYTQSCPASLAPASES